MKQLHHVLFHSSDTCTIYRVQKSDLLYPQARCCSTKLFLRLKAMKVQPETYHPHYNPELLIDQELSVHFCQQVPIHKAPYYQPHPRLLTHKRVEVRFNQLVPIRKEMVDLPHQQARIHKETADRYFKEHILKEMWV